MYITCVVCFFIALDCLTFLRFAFASLSFVSLVCNVVTRSCQNRWANLSMVLNLVSKFDCSFRSDNKPRFPPTMERGGFLLFSKPSSNSMLSLTAPFGVTTSLVFPLMWIGEDSSSFQSPHQTRCYVQNAKSRWSGFGQAISEVSPHFLWDFSDVYCICCLFFLALNCLAVLRFTFATISFVSLVRTQEPVG